MKSLKSKQNIAILMLTGIICLIIVGYALLTAYNTKISRSSAVQSSSSSVSQSSASSFYETLTLASSYSYNHLDFDNPFNNSKITVNNDYNIEVVGTCENEPYYLAGSECYIYVKCQITNITEEEVNNLSPTGLRELLSDLNSSPVEFYLDVNKLSTPSGVGASFWDEFCKWSNDGYAPYQTLNGSKWKDGSEPYGYNCFYLAVRTILPSTTGYHQIEVKYNGNTFCSFSINVKNKEDLNFDLNNAPSIKEANEMYYSNTIWKTTDNHIEYSQANIHPLVDTNSAEPYVSSRIYEEDSTTLGGTINTELVKLHDFATGGDTNNRYSMTNASMDLKAFLLYPEDGYSISTGQYIQLEGVHKCDDEDPTKCDSERKNYYQFNSSDDHIIPTDMSCLKQEGDKYYYVVKELVFNEWCPTGYVWFVIDHYYEVSLITIDGAETTKQQNYLYVENTYVYTNVAVNTEDESLLNNVKVNLEIDGNSYSTDKYKYYNNYYYFYMKWETPNIVQVGGRKTIPIKINVLYNNSSIGSVEFEIDINDLDFISEFNSVGINLNNQNTANTEVLNFENKTKSIYPTLIKNNDVDITYFNGFYHTEIQNEITFNDKQYLIGDEIPNDILKSSYTGYIPGDFINLSLTNNDELEDDMTLITLVLYPEYKYNIKYGTLAQLTPTTKSVNVIDRCVNKSLSNPNAHSIPLWWNEDMYIVVLLNFKWYPYGLCYNYSTYEYSVDTSTSILDDWYITRNVE